jgi:hypothetical protein
MKKAEFKMGENKDSVEAMTKTRTHMDTLACVSVSHCIRPQSCNAWQQEPVSYLQKYICALPKSQILRFYWGRAQQNLEKPSSWLLPQYQGDGLQCAQQNFRTTLWCFGCICTSALQISWKFLCTQPSPRTAQINVAPGCHSANLLQR